MASENISYETFQSWLALSVKNYELQQQLLSVHGDKALADKIQQQISENEESMEMYFPKTYGDVCSYRAYVSNEVAELKVNYFALNYPEKAGKLGVFLPNNITEESLNVQSEALKTIVNKVSDISDNIESVDYTFRTEKSVGSFSSAEIVNN